MYKCKHEELLHPPAYVPSENEIQLAKARYAMENNIWEMIHSLIQYHQMNNGKEPSFPYTKESVEKSATQAIERWDKAMNKWDEDIIDAFVDDEWFRKVYVSGLSDIHSGDCTGFACSCSRCHAEEIFGIPNTVTWGKSEGHRMHNEYFADFKRQKKEEEERNANGSNQE
jgi:hypothetical protein